MSINQYLSHISGITVKLHNSALDIVDAYDYEMIESIMQYSFKLFRSTIIHVEWPRKLEAQCQIVNASHALLLYTSKQYFF